jgi:hypothetical protein
MMRDVDDDLGERVMRELDDDLETCAERAQRLRRRCVMRERSNNVGGAW